MWHDNWKGLGNNPFLNILYLYGMHVNLIASCISMTPKKGKIQENNLNDRGKGL